MVHEGSACRGWTNVGRVPATRVLVAIPAWNEEGNIARVVTDARKAALDLDLTCEVLVMDGDSQDQTREEAVKAGARPKIGRAHV